MAAAIELNHIESPQPESAATLSSIVELVRGITHADTTSIVGFSLAENTITWKAAAGFRAEVVNAAGRLTQRLTRGLAEQTLSTDSILVIQGIGAGEELPANDFPIHTAEGIRDLAVAPLRSRGEPLGALLVGYRSPHEFTNEEKELLRGLADMATLALENARLVETLATAEQAWQQTFQAIGEGILAYDDDGRIHRCNARAAELLDMKQEDVTGLTFDEAFARMFGPHAAAYYLAEPRELPSSFEVQAESGRRYLLSISSIPNAPGQIVNVATWKDVTLLTDVREQLARSRRLGSVGQLAAGVAHEINNPLAAIATCAEAVIRDLRRTESLQSVADEHQWSYYLEEIVRQALRCKEITRGLLDLTQQRHAKRALCDLNAIVKESIKPALQRAQSVAVEFELKLNDDLGEIATDALMVRQILENLLNNAVDAIADHGGTVTVATAREGDRAVIEVADTGPGIAADLLARIFDPFVSTKGAGKGYGLGLAISASLAETLGASLTVESKEGEGSRFRLWIPRRAPEQ